MKALVVDTSAVFSTLVEEPQAPLVRRILADAKSNDVAMYVPSHFWLEVANGLVVGRRLTGAEGFEAIRELDEYAFVTIDMDRPLVLLAIGEAERHRLTVYDAAYLVLARQLEAGLLTLDRQLAEAAGDRAVVPSFEPPRLLSEGRAPYGRGTPASWPDYSGMSDLLAKLRADAETDLAEIGERHARSTDRA